MTDPRFQLNPFLDDLQFKDDVVEAFDEVPRVSYFSAADGPNSSNVTATQGTIGININPSARTVFWGCHRDGSSNWSELVNAP